MKGLKWYIFPKICSVITTIHSLIVLDAFDFKQKQKIFLPFYHCLGDSNFFKQFVFMHWIGRLDFFTGPDALAIVGDVR